VRAGPASGRPFLLFPVGGSGLRWWRWPPQELLYVVNQRSHPQIEGLPIELQWRWISVIPELHCVHRQNAEIIPVTGHSTLNRQQPEQPPQVMRQRWFFLP
jgi:hypothetical protein